MIKNLRCLSWIAVSSEEQARDGLASLPDQRLGNRQFIESIEQNYPGYRGILVEEMQVTDSRKITYLEDARQRYLEYDRLYKMIEDQSFDLLVCHKWDRLGRTETLLITIQNLCLDHGIVPVARESLPATLDVRKLRDDEGYRITGLFHAWGAGREVREISRRVRSGRTAAVRNKRVYPGELPYGYRYLYQEDGKREAVIDPGQARVVRLILVDMYLNLEFGRPSIAAELNQRNIPAPRGGKWTIGTIEHMVANAKVYAGFIEFNRVSEKEEYVCVRGTHPPILTEKELAMVEAERERRSYGPRRQHPYSGIFICNECGAFTYTKVKSYIRKTDGIINRYYYNRCYKCGWSLNESVIEAALLAIIDKVVEEDLAELVDESPDAFLTDLEREVNGLKMQLDQNRAAIQRWLDLIEKSQFDLGDHALARLHEREAEEKELRTQLLSKEG